MSIPNLLGYFQFRYRAGSSSLALPPATFASSAADAAGVRVPSAQALRLRRAEEIQHVWRPIILPAYYHMSIKKKKKSAIKRTDEAALICRLLLGDSGRVSLPPRLPTPAPFSTCLLAGEVQKVKIYSDFISLTFK